MSLKATQDLPSLFAGWIGDLLAGPVPREENATCDDCAMCVKPDGKLPSSVYFVDPALKCCVYMPELANFLIGRVLGDDDPGVAFGQETVRRRIAARIAVTPLGVGRPPSYDLLFRNSENTLGRSRALRCPHYVEEGGRCGIWRHRDSMCTTWFCRHERGMVGGDFWKALRELLVIVEGTLSRWCALRHDVDVEVLSRWIPRERLPTGKGTPEGVELDGRVDPDRYTAIWGAWEGREEEYYRSCAARVEALSWAEVMAIGGPEMEILAGVARRAYARLMATDLPVKLRLGAFQIAGRRDGGMRAVSYSQLDVIDLQDALLPVMSLFDGRPAEEILRDLAALGIGIQEGYLRRLCDFGILVEG